MRACGLGEPAFLLRDRLGTVALCVDDAEKTEGLLAASQKLVGGPGSNVYGIKRLHLPGLIVQHHPPLPAHGNHHMRVGMFLQAGVAARFDLKIAQMKAGLFGLFADQNLTDNAFPLSSRFLSLLIGFTFDLGPGVRVVVFLRPDKTTFGSGRRPPLSLVGAAE